MFIWQLPSWQSSRQHASSELSTWQKAIRPDRLRLGRHPDGQHLDHRALHPGGRARPRLAIPDKSAASCVIGLGLQDAMQAAMPDVDPKYYPRIVERYRHHYLGQDKDLTLFEGVPEMLADLSQQGYFLAVATGKSRVGLNRAMNSTGLLSNSMPRAAPMKLSPSRIRPCCRN
jgi:phosphoglycolate phosphatase-like HAD superfamily hydrolase